MMEYGICNINTQKETIIYGYSFSDACKKAGLNPKEWEIFYQEFID